MIRDSVAYLVNAGKRVIYDAEHFFDGYRDDSALRARVRARGGGRRRRERHPLRHQRLEPAGAGRRGDQGCRRAARRPDRDPHPQRPGVRGGELAGRGRAGREPGAGHDERDRRAHRQRQPHLDPARAPAQAGLRVREPGTARPADRDRPFHRRAAQHHPGSGPALRRPQRLRPQGRHARRGRQRGRPHLRAHGPGPGRQRARPGGLRALRQGDGSRARRALRHSRWTTSRPRERCAR